MNWAYSIKNKLTAAALLLVVLLLVMLNNFSERNYYNKLSSHINSIHDDRLLVENYIHQLSDNMHRVIELDHADNLSNLEKRKTIETIAATVQQLNADYGKTELTEDERQKFTEFKQLCAQILEHGKSYQFDQSSKLAQSSITLLNQLSLIQLWEAKSLLAKTNQIFNSGKSSSQFEMAILVVIAILIQVLIFSSASMKQKIMNQHPNLN